MSGYEIEIPSSPDPLGDETIASIPAPAPALAPAPAPPSTIRPPSTFRRFTQSTASSRFSALPGTSPRKRMFALDVGSEITPQTIYVTVEAGEDGIIPLAQGTGGSSVNRRLFGSPSPRPSPQRRIQTTTTTVPLKGLTDDESEFTPKPRHRRRTSSTRPGTSGAATSTTKGRKPRNSTPKTTKKQQETIRPSSDAIQSETPGLLGQPTPRRRGRPPKRKRPEDAASGRGGSEMPGGSMPKKRRGRRRQSLFPDELAILSTTANEATNEFDSIAHTHSRSPELTPNSSPMRTTVDAGNVRKETTEAAVEENERGLFLNDILNTVPLENDSLSQEGVGEHDGLPGSALEARSDRSPSLPDGGDYHDGELDAFAPMMEQDDRSDVESQISSDHVETEHQPSELGYQRPLPGDADDTLSIPRKSSPSIARSPGGERSSKRRDEPDKTLDAESFTMIGIDAMPSLRQRRGLSDSDAPEIGEETSFFINKTLESLREEIAESENDDVDILRSRDSTPAATNRCIRKTKARQFDDHDYTPRYLTSHSSRRTPRSQMKTNASTGSVAGNGPIREVCPPSVHEASSDTDGWPDTNNVVDEDDSFSDIPDEALAAAEAQDEPQPSNSFAAEGLNAHKQDAAIEAPNVVAQRFDDAYDQNCNHSAGSRYTSTQDRRNGMRSEDDSFQQSVSQSNWPRRAFGQQSLPNSLPPHSIRSRSDSNRLLTPPDDTSFNSPSPANDAAPPTEHVAGLVSDDIGSSPPELTTLDYIEPPNLPSRRNSDTPANRQPMSQGEQIQECQVFAFVPQPSHFGGSRPALSPVVRIGRTLQNILSDPPSPSGRSSVLGSPFKGSARNSSPLDGAAVDEALQNVFSANESRSNSNTQSTFNPGPSTNPQSARPWSMALAPLSQIKSLVSQGAQLFTSPHVNKPSSSDPFGPPSPSLSKRPDTDRNSFLNRIKQASYEERASSSRVGSRDDMDDNNERHRKVHKADHLFGQRADPVHSPLADQTSRSSHAPSFINIATGSDGTLEAHVEVDVGRSHIETTQGLCQPSAENVQGAKGALQEENAQYKFRDNIEYSELTDQPLVKERLQFGDSLPPEEQSEEEDIWAIEANRTASSPRYPDLPSETIDSSFRKGGLSIDWGTRSIGSLRTSLRTSLRNSQSAGNPASNTTVTNVNTATIEGLEDYSLLSVHNSSSPKQSVKKPTPQVPKLPRRVDLSDFFSSSPNFLERQRRAKEASLAKAPIKMPTAGIAPVAPQGETTGKAAESLLRASPSPSISEPLSPAVNTSDQSNQRPTSRTSLSVSPERNGRTSLRKLPQQEFTPHHGQNDAKLFESWAVSSDAATSRAASPERDPPQLETVPADAMKDSGSEDSDTPGTPPNLRPLPGRAASPSKSCLRSPLKPKTQGRVVDFTSSTVSTNHLLQSQAGYENRASIAMPTTSQVSLPGVASSGTENQNALPYHTSLLPPHKQTLQIPQERPQTKQCDSPLSQTRWSREHWLLLDGLLQSYRWKPLEFQLLHIDAITGTSPSKRASSRLLGKHLTSQGGKESLMLEQWHLDVADSFIKQVGGWNQEVIVKRLFALIVGEERRRLGLVPRRG